MTETSKQPVQWADDQTLRSVRPEVRALLEETPSFGRLPPEEQREIASAMVKVAAYMANPDGLAAQELSPGGGVLATAQADANEALRGRLAKSPGFAGKDFKAGAVQQGVQEFKKLVQTVDFPAFVSGLIRNVFEAIVDSSIKQMRAYGELLANVAKTVDQFAQDNITDNNARDWLSQRYPGQLKINTSSMGTGFAPADGQSSATAVQPRLDVTAEDASAFLREVSGSLQMARPVSDLSDEAEERRLVLAAKLQIARSRQQLLASMVVLGINRIVVTDGQINAKVVFDLQARDVAARRATASMYDRQEDKTWSEYEASAGSGWLGGIIGGFDTSAGGGSSSEHVATVQSAVDETSESRAEVKAKLSGEVRVNFKSDYFPMERMASPQMIAAIQGNAVPPERPGERTPERAAAPG